MSDFFVSMPDTHRVGLLASANISLGGLGIFVNRITPYLSAAVYLVQFIVGALTIVYMIRAHMRKNKSKDNS